MKQKNNNLWLTLIIVFLAGSLGFLGGWQYEKSKLPNFANRNGQFSGMMGANNRGSFGQNGQNRFRPILGEVTAKDDTSVTVKSQDGSSKIVLLTANTTIEKTETATNTDLIIGKTVRILGTENSDGSVTAQDIQLNPILRNISGSLNRPN